jgi:hypothetical protein
LLDVYIGFFVLLHLFSGFSCYSRV